MRLIVRLVQRWIGIAVVMGQNPGPVLNFFQALISQLLKLCITAMINHVFKLRLLINYLWFSLAHLEVHASFATNKYGFDCGLVLETKVFQLSLDNVSGILLLSLFSAITGEACDDYWSATLEMIKELMVELMRCNGYFRRDNTNFKRSNSSEKSKHVTMEIVKHGIQLLNRAPPIETRVYVKPINTGLLLHYQSHVHNQYKRRLLTTMLDRAYRLGFIFNRFDPLKYLFNLTPSR